MFQAFLAFSNNCYQCLPNALDLSLLFFTVNTIPCSSAAILWLFIAAKSPQWSGFLYLYALKRFQVSFHWCLCNCSNKMNFFYKGRLTPIHNLFYKRLPAISTPNGIMGFWSYKKRWILWHFKLELTVGLGVTLPKMGAFGICCL